MKVPFQTQPIGLGFLLPTLHPKSSGQRPEKPMTYKLSPDTYTAQVTPDIFIFYKTKNKNKKRYTPKCSINSDSGRSKQHSLGQKRAGGRNIRCRPGEAQRTSSK